MTTEPHALIRRVRDTQGGFLVESNIAVLAGHPASRLWLLLVRCGGGRFICAAQDVTQPIMETFVSHSVLHNGDDHMLCPGCGVMLSALIQQQQATIRELVEALEMSWRHTDDAGREFFCACPMYRVLSDDARRDRDDKHSTACTTGRAAIRKARGEEG